MSQYIMGLDIGNTNTVVGLFDTEENVEVRYSWRTVTRNNRTSDELGIFLYGFLQTAGIRMESIGGLIYSSVVPSFNPVVERMSRDYIKSEAIPVRYTMNMPLRIDYPRPYEIGADRLVNAVAVHHLHPDSRGKIIVDMGTATTFCYLRGDSYQGGSIAPGLKLSMEALSRNAAQISPIEFKRPPKGVLGDTTEHALQSGFFYGWVGLIREIVSQYRALDPEDQPSQRSTGKRT